MNFKEKVNNVVDKMKGNKDKTFVELSEKIQKEQPVMVSLNDGWNTYSPKKKNKIKLIGILIAILLLALFVLSFIGLIGVYKDSTFGISLFATIVFVLIFSSIGYFIRRLLYKFLYNRPLDEKEFIKVDKSIK